MKSVFKNRYERNAATISESEQDKLKSSSVCVIGCGGLGGHVISLLGRLGVGKITAVDGDVFEESNLNRQVFCDEKTMGQKKAFVVCEKMKEINSDVCVNAVCVKISADNAKQILAGHDVVVDALDNVSTRRIVAEVCAWLNVPLVHGAIAGWLGQVSVVVPNDNLFDKIYPQGIEKGFETLTGNPSFTPSVVASIQASEVVKLLLNKGEPLCSKLLAINLLENEFEIIQF